MNQKSLNALRAHIDRLSSRPHPPEGFLVIPVTMERDAEGRRQGAWQLWACGVSDVDGLAVLLQVATMLSKKMREEKKGGQNDGSQNTGQELAK